MLSGDALDLAYALREQVGALTQGDGPLLADLRVGSPLSEAGFVRAIDELQSVKFIHIAGELDDPSTTILVLAPLQIYLDDLENQGTDDI